MSAVAVIAETESVVVGSVVELVVLAMDSLVIE